MLRIRLAAAVSLSLAVVSVAQARPSVEVAAAPRGLTAFLLRADEAAQHQFARTPSFAWKPVAGAQRYEFELSKNPNFSEGSILWSSAVLSSPAVAIPVALPWMTGSPYAAYAHVRAITRSGAGPWSSAYGFNVRWMSLPQSLPTDAGLLRWSMVDGATSYDVWLVDANKVIRTKTNVADERDYYTFHAVSPWPDSVRWRVRPVRSLYGTLPNGLPAVTYGPWSPVYTSANPPVANGPLRLVDAVSDASSPAGTPVAHALTPAFAWTGNQGADGSTYELFRVYVFSDSDCVNVIFRGSIVGSPGFAPRSTGPLLLPHDIGELAVDRGRYVPDGTEGKNFMADTATVSPTEEDPAPAAQAAPGASGSSSAPSSTSAPSTTTSGSTQSPPVLDPSSQTPPDNLTLPGTPKSSGAPIDLWDSGWPNGRFYWTVVPVKIVINAAVTTALTGPVSVGATTITVLSAQGLAVGSQVAIGYQPNQQLYTIAAIDSVSNKITLAQGVTLARPAGTAVLGPGTAVEYHDAELPQDACAAGRVGSFGKTSQPAVAAASTPFASGLSPRGRLLAATTKKPVFYGAPLVAWQPALGADEYEVQWSPTRYPWNPVANAVTGSLNDKLTYATSALLPLTPGTWYYRVRGLDFSLPGTGRAMTWSTPQAVVVARPTFRVVSH